MKKIYDDIVKLILMIVIRIVLIILCVFTIIMIVKNVFTFAETIGTLRVSVKNVELVDVEDEETIEVELNYITASIDSADKYPEGWLKNFNSKIIELQKLFPNDMYWNHMGKGPLNPGEANDAYSVTSIPCNHWLYGEWYCNAYYGKSDEVYPYKSTSVQCRGFASLLSDYVFGEDAPVRVFENYDELRIGDQARIDCDYHSVFIIDKTDEYVIVGECNEDLQSCKISWGRKIMRENMSGWYVTRWAD